MRRLLPASLLTFVVCFGSSLSGCGDDGAGTGGGSSDATTAPASTGTSTGECPDGVLEDGVCVGKCAPELCAAGNTCAGNRCVLVCDAHDDCYPGSTCTDTTDDAGAAIQACTPSPKAAILGANCFFGNECDATTVCPDGTACGASLCAGGACADGACPDGTACTPQSCDATACRAPRCLGAVDGADQSPSGQSYCTQNDCTADTDCTAGMYCGTTRAFNEICGREGDLELGSEEPCIDEDDFTTDGKTYQEGPVSLLRNTCVFRRQCSPCATDLDCSGVAGQLCAEIGGENRCASTCATDKDCERDAECIEDPGHPGVTVCTPRFGSCVGEGEFCEPCVNDLDCGGPETSMICYPLAGSQRGCFDYAFEAECTTRCPDGTPCSKTLCGGKTCVDGLCHQTDPCDADPCDGAACTDGMCPDGSACDADPCDGGACIEGFCPDSIPCEEQTCSNSACSGANEDCPLAPDGIHHGLCFDEDLGFTPADPDYLKCFVPYFSATNRFQCW